MTDIQADQEELTYLTNVPLARLVGFERLLSEKKATVAPEIKDQIMRLARSVRQELTDIRDQIEQTYTSDGIYVLRERIRGLYGLVGTLLTASDWQSPSFMTSGLSQAGSQTGHITGTINDYKRDQHLDAITYETWFRDTYLDGLIKLPIQVFTTSSGMAAFTTIVQCLMGEGKTKGPVLVGKQCYFECKTLLTATFGNQMIEVPEDNTKEILAAITTHKPRVIFLDSLTNTQHIAIPDLPAIIAHLKKTVKDETYLIIDNTGLSVFCQPLKELFKGVSNLRIIVFESLNKYHQFGMDRVTGGIIYGLGRDVGKLFSWRMHLGTQMPDASVVSLPKPHRQFLERRLLRMSRNALFVATVLADLLPTKPTSPVAEIVYPGLSTHPAHRFMNKTGFYGSYLTLVFKKNYQTVRFYKQFVERVIKEAKKYHVLITSGTSFGLPTTRIYLTALRAIETTPFIRIAVGAESLEEIERITAVLTQCVASSS